jgi:endoglucanase
MAFEINRGTNISHWLSQSQRRGDERRAWFTRQDVQRIAEWGFDHVRIPIDEEQMWTAPSPTVAMPGAQRGARLLREHGLRAVVDLHILRSPSTKPKPPRPSRIGRFVAP